MTSRIATLAVYVVLPILGILFFGWDWRSVVLLYWLENVTLGLRTVISMIRTERLHDSNERAFTVNGMSPTSRAAKPAMIVFFIFHYGIFTLVHGVFVMLIINGVFGFFGGPSGSAQAVGIDFGAVLLIWGAGSLVQIAFDLFRPRSELPSASTLFSSPYGRIIALHLTILGGAWLISNFDWPPVTAILLVALHFITDLWNPLARGGRATPVAGRD